MVGLILRMLRSLFLVAYQDSLDIARIYLNVILNKLLKHQVIKE